jgi:hypothetical protein
VPHSASPKVQKYENGTNALEQAVAANPPTFWRVPEAFSFEGVLGAPERAAQTEKTAASRRMVLKHAFAVVVL